MPPSDAEPVPPYGLQPESPTPTPGLGATAPGTPYPPPPSDRPTPRPTTADAEMIFRFRADPRVLKWIGPAALVLALILSVFPWVGAYPGGFGVYTQSAWGMAFGMFTADPTGDEAMGVSGPDNLKGEKLIRRYARASILMILFVFGLLFAGLLAALDLFEPLITFPVPDLIQNIWPKRHLYLALSGLGLFGLLQLALWSGVGMEAATAAAADSIVPAVKDSSPTTKDLHVRQVQVGSERGRFAVTRTLWLTLASACLVIGAASYGLELWLERRGRRPEPRVELWW